MLELIHLFPIKKWCSDILLHALVLLCLGHWVLEVGGLLSDFAVALELQLLELFNHLGFIALDVAVMLDELGHFLQLFFGVAHFQRHKLVEVGCGELSQFAKGLRLVFFHVLADADLVLSYI